jgi:hypothetical protein
LMQYVMGFSVLKFRHMSEDALVPLISQGDRIAIDILTYRFRDPRVGEVVYYRPKPIKLVVGAGGMGGSNTYIEVPLNGIERVVAGPGETFARKGGLYFREGRAVPSWEAPINRTEVTWDYELRAPSDNYIVIRSYTSSDWLGPAVPPMNEVDLVQDWEDACMVDRSDIIGRAMAVYQPPEHRRRL